MYAERAVGDMEHILNTLSVCAVPFVITAIITRGLLKKVDIYSSFLEGAKEGIQISWGIVPPVVGLLTAIGMLRASGTLEIIINVIKPVTDFLKIPSEILPFALLRPVSGSGSLAMATDIFKNYGTDSLVGRAVAVMMGSTETTFYTLAVYFGAVKATDTRYSLKCALTADLVGMLLSVWICRLSL